ncbi:hypothetical protein M9H77_08717 [Catharanthus roseus]|uniref:Uncharacterized protein n=1 Tax=Catharanthus roseus TaxID=4058 RepID=A0ACC0BYH2_CATRO|nr:hypothetical protein M9H77_08717 [Catharanthus roseus]
MTIYLLCLGHLFGLISAVGFYCGGEPRFASSVPASVNNLSNLRSSLDLASEIKDEKQRKHGKGGNKVDKTHGVSQEKRERSREGGLPVTLVTAKAISESAISDLPFAYRRYLDAALQLLGDRLSARHLFVKI